MTDLLFRPDFVIDTCSLTELSRRYPRDILEQVWDHVEELINERRLVSIDEVFIELSVTDDQLLSWASDKREHGFFAELDSQVQIAAKNILSRHPTLLDIKRGKSSADPFLIAYAQTYDCVVVTEEKHSGGPPKKKIPDVCDDVGVRCIALVDMLRQTGMRLTSR